MSQYNFKTSRGMVRIAQIKKIASKNDRLSYQNIEKYRAALVLAKKAGDNGLADNYQNEIKNCRERLKALRPQTYVVEVYIPKYKYKTALEVVYNHNGFKYLIKEAIDLGIRHAREGLRNSLFPVRVGPLFTSKFGSKKISSVYAEEGTILKAHIQKNARLIYESKTPTLTKKYIGIELEFCAPIKEEQLISKLFRKGIHKVAQLKEDGSLRPKEKEFGYELAILLEESNYKKDLKKITDLLIEIKAVSKERRCGLHVHLDMRRRNKELVYNNLVACQYALLSVVDPVRYDNEFCRTVNTRKFPTEFTGDRQERYKTINAAAYYKYRTLEIRMHEGSVDYNEIVNWVDLLVKLANYSKKLKDDVLKLPVLHKRLKLTKKLYDYTLNRSCSWQVQNSERIQQMRSDVMNLRSPSIQPLINRIRGIGAEVSGQPENPWTVAVQATAPRSPSYDGLVYVERPGTTPSVSVTFDEPSVEEVNEMMDNQEEVAHTGNGN